MTQSDEITIFGLRALGPYGIVTGSHKVELSPNSWTHKYVAHWTGSEWEPYGQENVLHFDHRKYAEEYLNENKQLLLDKLREWNRT